MATALVPHAMPIGSDPNVNTDVRDRVEVSAAHVEVMAIVIVEIASGTVLCVSLYKKCWRSFHKLLLIVYVSPISLKPIIVFASACVRRFFFNFACSPLTIVVYFIGMTHTHTQIRL